MRLALELRAWATATVSEIGKFKSVHFHDWALGADDSRNRQIPPSTQSNSHGLTKGG
jgi:hypothetical protein